MDSDSDSDSDSGPMDSDSHLMDSDSGLMDSDSDSGLVDSDSLPDSRVRTHSNTTLVYICGLWYAPGGAVIFKMDTGVRPALRQAGAFGESTGSKNEGSLGESMIFGIR